MVENLIRRHVSKTENIIKWLLVVFTCGIGVIGLLTIVLLPAFFAALVIVLSYCRRLDEEYEYGYDKYHNILTIDKIVHRRKRYACLYTSMEQVLRICPYGKAEAEKLKKEKLEDYASHNPLSGVYLLQIRQGEGIRNILFEPQQDFLEAVRVNEPQKVTDYQKGEQDGKETK